MDLTELFCEVNDFCQDWLLTFSSTLFPTQGNNLPKCCRMTLSEVMTISIHFHHWAGDPSSSQDIEYSKIIISSLSVNI
jgi:hypothetical protein